MTTLSTERHEEEAPRASGEEPRPAEAHGAEHAHAHANPVKVWAILCVLLVVSVVGPMAEIRIVTLITAFGIAGVKAYLVAKHFLHLGAERRYIAYALAVSVAFMVLLFAGVAPDVMEHHGRNWKNVAAAKEVERALHEAASDEH